MTGVQTCALPILAGGKAGLGGSPLYTYSGIAVFRAGLFAGCRDGAFPLLPLLNSAITHQQISAEFYPGTWLDIGTPERLATVQESF